MFCQDCECSGTYFISMKTCKTIDAYNVWLNNNNSNNNNKNLEQSQHEALYNKHATFNPILQEPQNDQIHIKLWESEKKQRLKCLLLMSNSVLICFRRKLSVMTSDSNTAFFCLQLAV